jgi:hypothetical protein
MRCFRPELPLLYELKDCITDPASPDAYFQHFDKNVSSSTHVLELYQRWEWALQALDGESWEQLKTEIIPRLIQRDKARGWQQLFDTMGEARAYRYLRAIGCTGVRFIPRSRKKRTPDLEGTLPSVHLLCEVKTINPSNQEIEIRTNPPTVRSLPIQLTDQFLKKLSSTIDGAKNQLQSHDPERKARHLIYLNINFDDFFAECKEQYFSEIDGYLSNAPVAAVEIIICNDHTAYYKRLQMIHAKVDNID